MRLILSHSICLVFGVVLLPISFLAQAAFTTNHFNARSTFLRFGDENVDLRVHRLPRLSFLPNSSTSTCESKLCAKRKKGKKMIADIDFDLLDGEETMSKKDQLKAEKATAKAAKAVEKANEAAKKQENDTLGKKNGKKVVSDLDFDLLDEDEPMSKKDKLKAEKAAAKAAKVAGKANEADSLGKKKGKKKIADIDFDLLDDEEPMSKKDQLKAEKAAAKAAKKIQDESNVDTTEEIPKLSKKEIKMAKKAEKEASQKTAVVEVNGLDSVVDDSAKVDVSPESEPPKKKKITLEERIRKERPPPRIRVMENSQPNFSSLRLENVGVTFRDQEVVKDVTWGVQTGDRIGLVGHNGAGKTTQLRILAGELEPTTGDVLKSSKDIRVSMLRQEFVDELVLDRTLIDEFMSVFVEEKELINDLRESEVELERLAGDDPEKMQEVLDRMQELQSKAESKGVYALESRAKKIMNLMGFQEDEERYLVSMFSGGWKMRIGLGKVLLKEPNILMLDEPTNHLDLESVEWLEAFLIEQNMPMIIVSHDREFLDRVCNKIVDAEGGICTSYDGNYSRFLELKKARMDAWHAAFNAQEKKMKEEKQWINKFKVKQPQAVKQRKAKLEKLMKSDDYVKKPPFFGKPFKFRFPDAPRLSPEVANIEGVSHAYGEGTNRLFDSCDLFVEKNDRIAIVGPNGSGKSTLLRLLVGKEDPDEGSTQIVGQNIVMKYFEQNQADALDLTKNVIETIQENSNGQSYNELRALSGQFLFKGDDVEKNVANLSGGEKARLSLCCMMLEPANLLILDEPTNHLDIPAKEMLEEALQHFQGTVIVVSHDRYFISRVATTIVAIEDKKLTKYQGDYKFYMDKSKAIKEKVAARAVKGVERIGSAPIIDLDMIELNGKKKNFGGAKNANMVKRKDKGVKNAKRSQVS